MSKATIIFGSPRKNSNTHILVETVIKGLEDKDVSYKIFYLNEMDIKGCQACYYCKNSKIRECIIKDDMQAIYKSINESDGIIVASPIYFGGITSQTKTWLDRLFPYIDMQANSTMPEEKTAGLIITQNQPEPTLFTGNIKTFQKMLQLIGFIPGKILLACDLDKGYKPMVNEDNELLQEAYNFGRNFFMNK